MIPVFSGKEDSFVQGKLLRKAAEVFFMLFLLLKPFYLIPSGRIGAADVCMGISFCMTLGYILKGGSDDGIKTLRGALKHVFYREDITFYLFLICVAIINLCYAWIQKNPDFVWYTMYWFYNGAAIWTFKTLAGDQSAPEEKRISCMDFLQKTDLCLKLCILIQIIIWISGKGRYLTEAWGAVRYQGSFNDPNQLAFFMFASALLIYLHAVIRRRKYKRQQDEWQFRKDLLSMGAIVLATILIIASKSTGMILGMILFVILLWGCSLKKLVDDHRLSGRVIIFILAAGLLLMSALLVMIWPSADFSIQEVEYNTLTRIQEKIWKISNGGLKNLILDRGADKILAFPRYLLYGAGEGGFERFASVGYVNEIHSGIMSILFCYGIIPTALLAIWTIRTIRRQGRWSLCAVLALLCESFTLINYRQPLFWFVLVYSFIPRKIYDNNFAGEL